MITSFFVNLVRRFAALKPSNRRKNILTPDYKTTNEPWWYEQDRELFRSYYPDKKPTLENIRAYMNFEPTTPPDYR